MNAHLGKSMHDPGIDVLIDAWRSRQNPYEAAILETARKRGLYAAIW